MVTIRPQPRSTIAGQTAWAQLKTPVRLTCRSRSQSSGDWSSRRATWSKQARVGDEDVGRAELAVRGRLDLRAVGHVAEHGQRAPAEPADLLRGLLGVDEALLARRLGERPVLVGACLGLELDVGEHDVRAGPCQRERVGPAEPARAAGDERDPPGEIYFNRHVGEISPAR